MRKHLLILLCICATATGFSVMTGGGPDDPVPIPPGPQRTGDAAAGYRYIVTGDYVNSGLPLSLYRMRFGKDRRNDLRRDGLNATVRPDFNVVKAPNGTTLAVPNCLQCHAQVFNDSLIVGLGNSLADFTPVPGFGSKFAGSMLSAYMRTHGRKAEAAGEFFRTGMAVGGEMFTQVRGVNPADRLTALLITHRDRNTLAWQDSPSTRLPQQVIPTDVPAWWLLKKKNAMFYNGFGRGDFGRFLMGAILLTVSDTVHANRVDSHMNDVLAYIQNIQPPPYPGVIDSALAAKGKIIFGKSCAKCHGTYGEGGSYPNLLIPQHVIGTDSMINHSNYQYSDMVSWFNDSWFGKGDHPARLVPFNGFIAPPLDGVWITAPYLHNGSVPDIESLLNSALRPKYWSRNFAKPAYDHTKFGWTYKTEEGPNGTKTYDTTLPGYGNQGHRFGDKLDDPQRKAVIEYLKTL
jgi:mono/diheme cytochrome c family protein